jgi:hypothetical protein
MSRRHRRTKHRTGVALAAAIGAAMVFSVAAYGVLYSAMSFRSRVQFSQRNIKARYAAEAGLVWAMQQLWVNPAWTSSAGTLDLPFDVDQNGTTDATEGIDVIYAGCVTPPCPMQATVTY